MIGQGFLFSKPIPYLALVDLILAAEYRPMNATA
jgi:hypothetical protein